MESNIRTNKEGRGRESDKDIRNERKVSKQ